MTVREYCVFKAGLEPEAAEAHVAARRLMLNGVRIASADVEIPEGGIVNIGLDL